MILARVLSTRQTCLVASASTRFQSPQISRSFSSAESFDPKLVLSRLGLSVAPHHPSALHAVLEQAAKLRVGHEGLCRTVSAMKLAALDEGTIFRVLNRSPVAAVKGTMDIGPKVEFLRASGLAVDGIRRICFSNPEILSLSLDGRLKPLLEEFRDLGLDLNELSNAPIGDRSVILRMETGELSSCLELIRSLKCRALIKRKILEKGSLRAAIDVKLRVDCLCKHGLIRRDASRVLYLEPRVIVHSLEDLEKKIEFLLRELGFSIEAVVDLPKYLGVNLEKSVVPRHNVVRHLRSKGALGFQVVLKHMAKLSKHRFYNLFVKPYPECEEIFAAYAEANSRRQWEERQQRQRRRIPEGLWKQFKPPQKYQDSKEDARNMRDFMKLLRH